MTEPKKRTVNRNAALTATQAADRLSGLIGGLQGRIEAAQAEAEISERLDTHKQVDKIMARVPEPERQLVGKVLLALGCELNGIELQPSNDAPPADDGIPDVLPAGAQPLDPAREENIRRMTGGGRK